ncbi:tRNA (adenosine(37)-N6)-threonylcarbamoyltransferase complex ATPase subunit type 1 TsaE [Halobacteriovorax marinus]|uniref:tRNA (adenosine(37)-N6)-threonylcarbamoyltransferase complex ATPase subunit type 1 TsaE n=1 Tax=Halobacteriovorax marinus TaxID=97084 RepID=UPI000BC2DBD1|nr:tRNA (adenosine(37)-N6)-threonylcarbamoyltransferase complex ATPase subunit type 1 TsaE [Halobacteriovorax marinus]ATH08254.1 tRNA (adenosine(37)-N6)-threonylcarbamoyltransferase complex ATPase subunit type 1 TsaE [Halobacteriovorax marinus]
MELIKEWDGIFEENLESLSEEIKSIIPLESAIILTGAVGAGKTTFTKSFIDSDEGDEVCSPTYSVINENGNCAHADFYRLKDSEEVIHLELGLYLDDKDYFLIEWGAPFLKEISRNLDEQWEIFELKFEINSQLSNSDNTSSRKIQLFKHF